MAITTGAKPKQRIPKSKKNKEWGIQCADYYDGRCSRGPITVEDMDILYRLAFGELDEKDYSYATKPLGKIQDQREELQGDPGKLRNYPIITPIVTLLMGEKNSRPSNHTVVAVNSDVDDLVIDLQRRMMLENELRAFRKELQNMGVPTEESGMVKTPQEIAEEAKSLPDLASIQGQKGLDYIKYFNELPIKIRVMFLDWLTLGCAFSYRDVFKNDTVFERVSPRDIRWTNSNSNTFVEDGEAAVVDHHVNISDIIDKWGDELTEDELQYLEGDLGEHRDVKNSIFGFSDIDNYIQAMHNNLADKIFGARSHDASNGVTIQHVVWKSQRKLGILKVYDLFGNVINEVEVDEDFKERPGETIEWQWVNEVYEIWRYEDIYFGFQELPLQRHSMNNVSKCKLPYNGRFALVNTVVRQGKPYQELYNIVKYRLERALAKMKSMVVMPLGAIPESRGLDMFSTMYYGDTAGWLWVDESNPKALAALSNIREISNSMGQLVKQLYDIATAIKVEYEESVGITRQRKGQAGSSDLVGVNERAVYQSNATTEEMFQEFDDLIERDYQALLDLSKFAWIEGKKSRFINSTGDVDLLEIIPEDYVSADYGVFAKNNREEREKLDQFKAQTQAFAQNGYGPGVIGKIIDANNFDKLMDIVDQAEKEAIARSQQEMQSRERTEEMKKTIEKQMHDEELQFDYIKLQEDNQTKKDVALINAQSALTSSILGINIDNYDNAKSILESALTERDKLSVEREKLQVDREKANIDLQIAKTNKNKYDK